MDKYSNILPILGVLLGWILSELSARLKGYRQDVNLKRKIISDLLTLRTFTSYQIMSFHESAKYTKTFGFDFHEMEVRRKKNIQLGVVSIEEAYVIFKSTKNELSYIDPILSEKISYTMLWLKDFDDISLSQIANQDLLYIDMILSFETILEMTIKEIEKIIKKMSLSVGLITAYRIFKLLNKKSYDSNKSVIDFLNPDKVKEYIEKSKNNDSSELKWYNKYNVLSESQNANKQ